MLDGRGAPHKDAVKDLLPTVIPYPLASFSTQATPHLMEAPCREPIPSNPIHRSCVQPKDTLMWHAEELGFVP